MRRNSVRIRDLAAHANLCLHLGSTRTAASRREDSVLRSTRNMLRSLLALLLLASIAHAQRDATPAEHELLELTNQFRAQQHLPLFTWDPALARAARLHAFRIATEPGSLEHQYPGEPDLVTRASHAGAHFEVVSENIARRAQSPAALLDAWLHTAPHRATLLNPQLTSIGIGIAIVDGLLSGVQDFSTPVPVLTRELVEARVIHLLHTRGLDSVSATGEARAACDRDADSAPNARLVLHWQGSELARLPPEIHRELTRATYTSAAVGACHVASTTEGFTTYNMTLLFY